MVISGEAHPGRLSLDSETGTKIKDDQDNKRNERSILQSKLTKLAIRIGYVGRSRVFLFGCFGGTIIEFL